jgi:uncharacterized membrane protein YfhO
MKYKIEKFVSSAAFPPLIVMAVFALLYSLREIHPFGEHIIDVWDMTQVNVPLYHHVWDWLHGEKSLFFDWYSGLGTNMAASAGMLSFLSPFNLFFLLIERDSIHMSMGVFTAVKFMAASAAMHIFLKRTFIGTPALWLIIFSVSYAFSGFSVMYYCNNQWLDIAAFFPIVMLGIFELFLSENQHNGKRKHGAVIYCASMTLCLIANFYIGVMVLLFVFLISGFFLIAVPKADKQALVPLGIATAVSAALSAFIILPAVIQINNSARGNMIGGANIWQEYLRILNAPDNFDINRLYMLFPLALPAAIIAVGIVTRSSGRRTAGFWLGSILFVAVPLFVESTNLIWHGGSYIQFPVRFGFILTFMVIAAACYYKTRISRIKAGSETVCKAEKRQKPKRAFIASKIAAFLKLWVLVICGYLLVTQVTASVLEFHGGRHILLSHDVFVRAIILTFALFAIYAVACFIKSRKKSKLAVMLIAFIFALEIFSFSYVYIGYGGTGNLPTYNRAAVELSLNSPNELSRIRVDGSTLNSNYPFILRRASISNWTHTLPKSRQDAFRQFGYSTTYTRTIDTGGTAFSDALFGVRGILTTSPDTLSPLLYESRPKRDLNSNSSGYRYYSHRYTLPFGIVTARDSLSEITEHHPDAFFYTNAVYRNMFSQSDDLIRVIKFGDDTDESVVTHFESIEKERIMHVSMEITGRQVLYFAPAPDADTRVDLFTVNSRTVFLPDFENRFATNYPRIFENGMVMLGVFENETAELTVNYQHSVPVDMETLALLDLDKLDALAKNHPDPITQITVGKRGLELSLRDSPANRDLLFLPIAFDEGWSAQVNGEPVELIETLGAFIGVPIQAGNSDISLTFTPPGLNTGGTVTLLGVAAVSTAAVFILLAKKLKFVQKSALLQKLKLHRNSPEYGAVCDNLCDLYMLAWFGFVAVIYFIPVAHSLMRQFVLP